jgi:hypothetical protein
VSKTTIPDLERRVDVWLIAVTQTQDEKEAVGAERPVSFTGTSLPAQSGMHQCRGGSGDRSVTANGRTLFAAGGRGGVIRTRDPLLPKQIYIMSISVRNEAESLLNP